MDKSNRLYKLCLKTDINRVQTNVDRMKKIPSLTFLAFFAIFIVSCAAESEYLANLPNIDGFEVKKFYRLNGNLLVAYIDSSDNRLVYKLNENSATWKRILFKTKLSL